MEEQGSFQEAHKYEQIDEVFIARTVIKFGIGFDEVRASFEGSWYNGRFWPSILLY